ncbi:hypothetical protein G7Y31_01270 [Corynebacterium lizhenjunii]|uniref:Uncharacterized protein n=1 Tax=Corynebacterium lizhenjunii TaxID=2709394 RepID=A0A7T0PAR8_9CORY|nr:hypothetical protein [Corynebacterium lizhenjunii]QPK79381.1 hypothetical protein G7Y31_01270 [Corynebacterium lizhenjunii]
MSHNHAVADFLEESYPKFPTKIQDSYIEGYDPVSYAAPHSSLLRAETWIGMGFILSLLPALGTIVWGVSSGMFWGGSSSEGSQPTVTLIVGIVMLVVVAITAVGCVHYGRRFYRAYRAETGRVN